MALCPRDKGRQRKMWVAISLHFPFLLGTGQMCFNCHNMHYLLLCFRCIIVPVGDAYNEIQDCLV